MVKLEALSNEYYGYLKEFLDLDVPAYLYSIVVDDVKVGYAKIDRSFDKNNNMLDFYIMEDYRGNNYGRDAFKLLLSEARTRGYKNIVIFIETYNMLARRLIENNNGVNLYNTDGISKYVISFNN